LTGTAFGVLFVPAKGHRTRKNIINGVQNIIEDFKKKMRNEAKDLHKKAEDLENLAKDKMEESSKHHN